MLKKYIIITSVIFSCLFGLNPSYAQSPIVDVNFKVNDIYEDEESVIIQAIVYNLGNTNINGFNDIDVVLKSMNDELIALGTFEIDDLKAISFEPGESFFFTGAMNKTAPVTYPYKYIAETSVNWNNITELSDDIKVYINSEKITLEQNPVIINNRMLVPISTIASNFDYEVNEANFLLGQIYLSGKHVVKDIDIARKYLLLADIDKDHLLAQELLIIIGRN